MRLKTLLLLALSLLAAGENPFNWSAERSVNRSTLVPQIE